MTEPLLAGATRREEPRVGARHPAEAASRLFGHMAALPGEPKPTTVVARLTLARDPGADQVKAAVLSRLRRVPRFRSKLVVGWWGGHFEEVALDEAYHFRVVDCGAAGLTHDEVNRVVEEQSTKPLDLSRPLWRLLYVPRTVDGGAVGILVVSHAIGDGAALMHVLVHVACDATDAEEQKLALQHAKRAEPPAMGWLRFLRVFLWGVVEGFFSPMFRPDPQNPLKMAKATPAKRVATAAEPVALDRIKRVARAAGAGVTVNDVILAVFTRMVRRFFVARGHPEACRRLVRAQIPMDMRRAGEPRVQPGSGDPFNKFAFGMLRLPMDDASCETPLKTIAAVTANVEEVKVSPAPHIQLAILPGSVKTVPRATLSETLYAAANLPTFCISCPVGPSVVQHFLGVPIKRFEFNLFTGMSAYVSVLSYAGAVTLGVNLDAGLGVDPGELTELWADEFGKVEAALVAGEAAAR